MKTFLPPHLPSFQKRPRCIATIGIFDGFHSGHRYILKKVVRQANEKGVKSLLVSLYPHPLSFYGQDFPGYLTTQEEKTELLKGAGLDYFWVIRFNKRLARMSGSAFLAYLLRYFRIERIVVAKDFRFGHRAKDTIRVLAAFCNENKIELNAIEKKRRTAAVVSSSLIRSLVKTSSFASAEKFLGRPYSLRGKVRRGKGIGKRVVDIPTLNLDVDQKILPALGVYVTKTRYRGRLYPSVSLLGVSPTFFKRRKLLLETHILDFHRTLYGKTVEVIFVRRLRSERAFPSVASLKTQIARDIQQARSYFRSPRQS